MQFTDVQAHTLKPGNASTSGDMNQVFDGTSIVFVNDGEGHCLQAKTALWPGMGVDAPVCDSQSELQNFEFVEVSADVGEIRLLANPDLCLGSGTVTSEAGPYFRRDLTLDVCENFQEDYRTWQRVI